MKSYAWLLVPLGIVVAALLSRPSPIEPTPRPANANAPRLPTMEEAEKVFRREARIAVQRQKEARVKAAIDALSAQGITEEDLKEHFREEIEEAAKEELNCSSSDDIGDGDQGDNRYFRR